MSQDTDNDKAAESPSGDSHAEIERIRVALDRAQAEKKALCEENERLNAELKKKQNPPEWKTQREETRRLEREAERQKVRSGEKQVVAPPVDPLDSLLMEDTPEGQRTEDWIAAVDRLDWSIPEEGLLIALKLVKAYHLLPNCRIGPKRSGFRPTVRSFLNHKFEKAAEEPIIQPGPDGQPAFTETGKFFVDQLNKAFGSTTWYGLAQRSDDGKPDWEIPSESVSRPASELYELMSAADNATVFSQGGTVVETVLDDEAKVVLKQVTPNRMISLVEDFVRPFVWKPPHKAYKRLLKKDTEPLLEIPKEIAKLPRLAVLANAPVLVRRSSGKSEILKPGYDRESGIYVAGGAVREDITVPEAVDWIKTIYSEFRFASESDLSRAIASTITPALVLGALLNGRPAVDVAEADQSQAGKGYRHRMIAATYNEPSTSIANKEGMGGVGSLEESFDTALLRGSHFIRIDNFRGALRSQKIESFLTEPSYMVRLPFLAGRLIDPRRRLLFITSNGMEMTPDMANRCSISRIRKQEDRNFYDVLGHIHQDQDVALGCVLAISREWLDRGRPRTEETRHDFRPWVQSLDWIVQNLFKLPPLMDCHEALQGRISSPYLTWLRSVAIAVERKRKLDEDLRAHDLVAICYEHAITIPTVRSGDEKDAARAVGRIMSRVFEASPTVAVDEYRVERGELSSTQTVHHDINVYCFTKPEAD